MTKGKETGIFGNELFRFLDDSKTGFRNFEVRVLIGKWVKTVIWDFSNSRTKLGMQAQSRLHQYWKEFWAEGYLERSFWGWDMIQEGQNWLEKFWIFYLYLLHYPVYLSVCVMESKVRLLGYFKRMFWALGIEENGSKLASVSLLT